MNPIVRRVLLEARLKSGKSEYVFPEATASTLSALSNRFTYLCKGLGIDGVSFHSLRHTCGTRLAEMEKDISTISKALGHSSIDMSMRYVHPKESVRRAMDELANFRSFTTNSPPNEDLDRHN